MRFAVVGSGAVGGYYGAKLQRAGHEVTLIARGKNLAALREKGMTIESAALGHFQVKPRAEESAANVWGTEVVLLATKTYDNDTAIPLVEHLLDQGAPGAYVLSLQNGVSSPYALAEAVGDARVMAGPTYVAAALVEPGRIVQTGTHRRIAFGEIFNIGREISARARTLHEIFAGADIISEPHADGRVPRGRSTRTSGRSPRSPARRGCRSDPCGRMPGPGSRSSPRRARCTPSRTLKE